jgi:hypothetical protein
MAEELRESLSSLTVDVLRWYAGALPVAPAVTRKADWVAAIERVLLDPAEVGRLWEQLAPEQREVVALAVHELGGRYDAEVVNARLPRRPRPRSSASLGYYGTRSRESGASAFDLLFCAGYGTAVPRQVLAVLRKLAPKPAPMRLEGQVGPPVARPTGKRPGRKLDPPPEVMVAETERAAPHDLAATLQAVQAGKVGVGASGLPTLPSARLLRERLLLGDYFADDYARADDAVRPIALAVLVQAAGWAKAAGKAGGKLALTKRGQAVAARRPSAEDLREAWQSWLASDLLDELSRVRAIKGRNARGVHLTRPAERRERLPAILRDLPVGRWVELDELFRYARAGRLGPTIERGGERSGETGLYVGYSQEHGWLGYQGVDYWDVVIGSYLRATLWEYAATLGVIDVAYTRPEESPHDFGDLYGLDDEPYLSRYDGLLGVRVTALGAYVLGLAPEYRPPADTEPERPAVKVLPNLDVVVTDPAALAPVERASLEQVAEHTSLGVYRLDRERLLQAAEQGTTVEQVRQLLARASGQPADDLPQTVGVFLADVERRAGQLRETGRWIALESDDPYLLTELANSAALRGMVRLASVEERTILLVAAAREAAARRQLKRLGYVASRG